MSTYPRRPSPQPHNPQGNQQCCIADPPTPQQGKPVRHSMLRSWGGFETARLHRKLLSMRPSQPKSRPRSPQGSQQCCSPLALTHPKDRPGRRLLAASELGFESDDPRHTLLSMCPTHSNLQPHNPQGRQQCCTSACLYCLGIFCLHLSAVSKSVSLIGLHHRS